MINTSRRELLRLQNELDELEILIVRAEATGSSSAELTYLKAQRQELRRRLFG